MVNFSTMPRPRDWHPIPARTIDPRVYGRTIRALVHRRGGAMLLHHKFSSRNSRIYDRCGQWRVVVDREVIRSKTYYNSKEIRQPPLRWANQVLRRHAAGTYEKEWAEREARLCDDGGGAAAHGAHGADADALDEASAGGPSPSDKLVWHPPGFDELPRSLAPYAKQCRTTEHLLRKRPRRIRRRRRDAGVSPAVSVTPAQKER